MKTEGLKYIYILITALIFCVLISSQVNGQDLILGAKYGFGSGKYLKPGEIKEINSSTIHTIGLSVGFSPFFSKMAIMSGVMYEFSPRVEYIAIPLGTRVFVGNKFRFVLEGGLQYAFLATNKDSEYKHVDVFRTELSTGLEYAPDRRIRFECMVTRKVDARTSLIEERIAPFNQTVELKYRFKGYVISTSIKVRF